MIILRPFLNSIFYRPQVNSGLERLKDAGNYSYKEIESIRRHLGWNDVNDLPRIINGSIQTLEQTGHLDLEELKICIDHFRFIQDSRIWERFTPDVISGFKKIRETQGYSLYHLETYMRYVHYGNNPNEIAEWIARCIIEKESVEETECYFQEADTPEQLVA